MHMSSFNFTVAQFYKSGEISVSICVNDNEKKNTHQRKHTPNQILSHSHIHFEHKNNNNKEK